MAQGINLLPELSETEIKTGVYKKKVNIVAIAALLAVALIFLALFSYQLFLQTSRSRVESQSKELEGQISAQKTKEISQRTLVDKLDEIDRLLSTGVPTASAVASISNLVNSSGNTNIKGFSVKSDGDLEFTAETSSPLNFEKIVDGLTLSGSSKIFGEATLVSLSSEEGSPITFTVSVDFKPRGLKN